MKREDIIRMAMKADFIPIAALNHAEALERFAALVLADNSSAVWQQGCDAGRRSEREACVKVIESHGPFLANGALLVEAIRARKNT